MFRPLQIEKNLEVKFFFLILNVHVDILVYILHKCTTITFYIDIHVFASILILILHVNIISITSIPILFFILIHLNDFML